MQDQQWKLAGRQRKVSCTGFLGNGVSRMSPCGLTDLLLAPWWARLQHYASLTGLPLLSIIVLSERHTHTLSCRVAHMNTPHFAAEQTSSSRQSWYEEVVGPFLPGGKRCRGEIMMLWDDAKIEWRREGGKWVRKGVKLRESELKWKRSRGRESHWGCVSVCKSLF